VLALPNIISRWYNHFFLPINININKTIIIMYLGFSNDRKALGY